MTKVQNFSGIDISKNSFDVCLEHEGRYRHKKFSYTEEGMESCVKFITPDTHCIMESTGTYHCRLAHFLHTRGITVSVVNPLSVKRFAQALMLRSKTDSADSRMLAMYGRKFTPAPWLPKKDYCIELQQLINLQQLLIKQLTADTNQLEANAHSVVRNPCVQEVLRQQVLQTQASIKQVEKQLEEIVQQYDKQNYDNVSTIPGIGKKTAIVLIAMTQNMEAFDSAKQVCSYFGLCPRLYESGTSVKGRAKICKMGMVVIRKLLYMCALSAKRYNKACRELYERLVAKGKSKKLILIAIANKLVKQVFAIMKNKTTYNENILSIKFAY